MERPCRRRRRPALSCLECRRRKIKCDRENPCGQCVSAGTGCTFRTYRDGPGIPPSMSTSPSRQARQSTDPAIGTNNGERVSITPAASWKAAEKDERSQAAPEHGNREDLPTLQDLLSRLKKLEHASAASPDGGLSETGRHILARQSGLEDSQITLNKTRLLRWSNWVGAAREFETIGACYTAALGSEESTDFNTVEIRDLTSQIGQLLTKCKAAARALKVGRPTRSLTTPGLDLPLPPPREISDRFARLYFQSFESTFRILHAPTFWNEYQTLWDSTLGTRLDQRLIILLVVGIGSSLCESEDLCSDGFRRTVHQWVYAAQSWLSGPLEKDRLGVSGIQIYCLTILARQIFAIGGDLVWMSTGSLVHRAMQIGLHRDPKNLPAMSVLTAEVRRRLWATIMELAMQASLDSAMPPRLSLDEFDTEAPANVDDEDMDGSTSVLDARPKSTFTTSSLQLLLLDSLPLRLRILQHLNGLHSELSYVNVLSLSKEVTETCRAHTRFLKSNAGSDITPFHRNLLDYLVRRFMIPLHCVFANHARTIPLFHYSLRVNLDTAIAIISPEPDESYARLMLIGGGMFREGIRYANTVIGLELLAQSETQSLEGTLRNGGAAGYTSHLKTLVHDMTSLALERIRKGETNVKSHMFLRMILAQAACIEQGVACEYEVARGARDSLEVCFGILRERAGGGGFASPGSVSDFAFAGEGEWEGVDLDFFFSDVGFS